MGYDNTRVYKECEERDCAAIIPLRGVKAEQQVLPVVTPGRHNPRTLINQTASQKAHADGSS